ncbi:tryptophan-rich sensory protein [Antarcticibacterium arcticum]|uniref:Tryptophan-rich sensory protein n=1 Tax=Antarcticibacterium arcticum TaxID=2585771 RepID=A0A5B8YKU1_9FLAO|nr:TspO/MBR family protein [Antarcticibacterium arcticum]QED38231.1 tryptophan-rich sensory protein [Antarcticibacterium arcticum]
MSLNVFVKIFLALAICLFIGFMASLATQVGITDWYPTLNKPWFNPPDWIFGPVWGMLYVLMGIAAGIVWSKGFYHKWVKTALYHFMFQLLLNGAWSILFFGLKEPFWALLDIVALFVILIFTIKWFKIVSDTAAYLLIPYAVWVLFAAILNFEIWRLN